MGARVRVDVKSLWGGTLGAHWLRWTVAGLVALVVVLDSGSVFLTRMQLSDDGHKAGRAAAQAVAGLPLTPETAETGFAAAKQVATFKDGVTIRESDFEVRRDGSVALSLVRTAPSLVLGRVPWLAHYGVVVVPVVVAKPLA